MASADRVRLEIAFEGAQALTVYVMTGIADELDRALGAAAEGVVPVLAGVCSRPTSCVRSNIAAYLSLERSSNVVYF